MRQALPLLSCVLLWTSPVFGEAHASTFDRGCPVLLERVRGANRAAAELIQLGYRRSSTLRSIIDSLEASNVITYVEIRLLTRTGVGGYLTIVENPRLPFLRIVLGRHVASGQLLGLLGHELQHALEVSDAGVRNGADLRQLYEDIGDRQAFGRGYDSAEARQVGVAVLREVAR